MHHIPYTHTHPHIAAMHHIPYTHTHPHIAAMHHIPYIHTHPHIAAMHHIPYTHTQVYTGMHDISCIQTIKRKCIETIAKGQLLHKLEASMLYLVGYYKAIQ